MRLKSRIERAASQAREMADRETAGRLDDQERAARIEALFQAGRLARDSSGSFYAPDPENVVTLINFLIMVTALAPSMLLIQRWPGWQRSWSWHAAGRWPIRQAGHEAQD